MSVLTLKHLPDLILSLKSNNMSDGRNPSPALTNSKRQMLKETILPPQGLRLGSGSRFRG